MHKLHCHMYEDFQLQADNYHILSNSANHININSFSFDFRHIQITPGSGGSLDVIENNS